MGDDGSMEKGMRSFKTASLLALVNLIFLYALTFTPVNNVISEFYSNSLIGAVVLGGVLYTSMSYIRNNSEKLNLGYVTGLVIVQMVLGSLGTFMVANVPGYRIPVLLGSVLLSLLVGLTAYFLVTSKGKKLDMMKEYAKASIFGVILFDFFGNITISSVIIGFLITVSGFLGLFLYSVYFSTVSEESWMWKSALLYFSFFALTVHVSRLLVVFV